MTHLRAALYLASFALIPLLGCAPAGTGVEGTTAVRALEPALEVEIRPGTELYAVRGLHSVIIRFRNRGPGPVSILKPLDGSTECWHMPYYRLTVLDRDGKTLKSGARCGLSGLWANTEWPRDYLVEIKAGDSFNEEVPLDYDIIADGPYTIGFEYVYQPKDERFEPPPSAWRGSVQAAEVVLDFKRISVREEPP